MTNRPHILWSPEALNDLRKIRLWINNDNPEAAKKLAKNIRENVNRLSEHPLSGRVVPEFPHRDYREIIIAPYRVIYAFRVPNVVILRVWHSRRDLQNIK